MTAVVLPLSRNLLLLLLLCSSYLCLLALYVLYPPYLIQLFRSHALPAVWYNSMRSEGTLGTGRILCEEVTIEHVCHLGLVVVVCLLLL